MRTFFAALAGLGVAAVLVALVMGAIDPPAVGSLMCGKDYERGSGAASNGNPGLRQRGYCLRASGYFALDTSRRFWSAFNRSPVGGFLVLIISMNASKR